MGSNENGINMETTGVCDMVLLWSSSHLVIQDRAKVSERPNISENINFLKKWFRQKKMA